MSTKLKVQASDVPELVRQYDPRQDPRVWQAMSRMWRIVAEGFVELADGYRQDGRTIGELKIRLQKELQDRLIQEEGEFKTAAEKFERNAHEAVYNTVMDERIESISRGNQELEKARGEAARMNAEADRKRREERYQAEIAEAERRRNGGITEPAFFK
jgi:hypothetical protein